MLTALGKVLRVIRIERGMLLKNLAELMGVKPSYISSIENGKRKPSDKFFISLKEALELSGDELKEVENAYWETIEEVSLRLNSDKPYQIDLGLTLARSFEKITPNQASEIERILKQR